MRGVVEEDVSQVASFLPDASWFAFEDPVPARSPDARAEFHALSAVPVHVVDEVLGTNMVADQVLIAGE